MLNYETHSERRKQKVHQKTNLPNSIIDIFLAFLITNTSVKQSCKFTLVHNKFDWSLIFRHGLY